MFNQKIKFSNLFKLLDKKNLSKPNFIKKIKIFINYNIK